MITESKSSGCKIAEGIEKNLQSNLAVVSEQISDIQHRLDALLVTTDGVLDEETSNQLAQVRRIMSKIPAYREKCAQVQRRMESCDRRVLQLGKLSKSLRSHVVNTTPFSEEFPANAIIAADEGGHRGLLFYKVVYRGGVSIRSQPSFDAPRTGTIIPFNDIFQGIVRYSPNGSDMFVCLADGSGWVFESKDEVPILERVPDPTAFIDHVGEVDDDEENEE
jgi:hypothetical protein